MCSISRPLYLVCLAALLVVALPTIVGCGTLSTEDGPLSIVPDLPSGVEIEGKIAVIKGGDVWLLKRDGFEQLTQGVRYCCPAWSPDGKLIAVSLVGDNHSDIVIVDQDGAQDAQLTNNWSNNRVQDCAWARSPAWSPDGSVIACASDLANQNALTGPTDLWLLDATGQTNGQMMERPFSVTDVDYPSWSPDGQFLAVTGFGGGKGQIYRVDINSGQWTCLTDAPEGALLPAWSPDGTKIACVIRTGGESDIWLINADGSGLTQLTKHGTVGAPTWSPDGDQIAYLAGKPSSDLYVISSTPGASDGQGQALTSGAKIETTSRLSWAR